MRPLFPDSERNSRQGSGSCNPILRNSSTRGDTTFIEQRIGWSRVEKGTGPSLRKTVAAVTRYLKVDLPRLHSARLGA
jgi:hypothetical protein